METSTASAPTTKPRSRWPFIVLLLTLVMFAGTWRFIAFAVHGSAWGGKARANAEAEALRYARARFEPNLSAASVICRTHATVEADCNVTLRSMVVSLECDDDDASDNDGCSYKSARPFGVTVDTIEE